MHSLAVLNAQLATCMNDEPLVSIVTPSYNPEIALTPPVLRERTATPLPAKPTFTFGKVSEGGDCKRIDCAGRTRHHPRSNNLIIQANVSLAL